MARPAGFLATIVLATVLPIALVTPVGHAQQAAASGGRRLPPAPLALHRARGQPVLGRCRHRRRSADLLRRRRVGRHLQDHRRRRALAADLRRSAGAVDRLARRRAVRPQRRLGRHRRGQDPQPHLGRPGHLQVHRRRQDVDADGPRADGPHPAPRRSTRRTRTSCSPARSATPTGRSRSAACSGPPTAARRGRRRCSWTRTRAARTSRWIRTTRASCSPACGSSRSTPGAARAAGRAAASSCRATAARRGRS